MQLIDTHTHLYLPEFEHDIETVINTALQQGIAHFYLPAIDSQHHEKMFQLEKAFPCCTALIGLHPCSVKENVEDELNRIKNYLTQRKFVAIGEIGLDYYWDKTFETQQIQAFNQQMEWALQYNIAINIHTRNALQDAIELVKPFAAKGLRGIFHCFGGSYQQAKQIIDLNFLMGIGGVVTYKNAGVAQVVANIPMQHIVLETDAPYLTPVPHRGKRNEPQYLLYIAQTIADIKQISIEEVAIITTQNANTIYKP
jgi:TatD DNase family protein